MKLKLIVASALAICSLFIVNDNQLISRSTGSPGANTGAPGQFGGRTCNTIGCHAGSTTPAAGLITSTIPIGGYIPGQTYTITGSITEVGRVKFGFEISPQNMTGTFLGTLQLTNTSTTKFTNGGGSVTHTSIGNAHPSGTATWSFDWTAPMTGTGDVTFYGAFNASNSSNTASGDNIYSSTLTVPEDFSIGVEDVIAANGFVMYPNPAAQYTNIEWNKKEPMNVNVYNLNGKLISSQQVDDISTKINTTALDNGIYFVELKSVDSVYHQKLMVQHQ
ncbi:MAG: T9SS type A sorting domain-containing protein [Bacteroidia bacterium]|nr:T9SS type A sorting domain-containing protein [Bacteroidia bacterium]